MNGRTFSQNPRKRGKTHYHHMFAMIHTTKNIYFQVDSVRTDLPYRSIILRVLLYREQK